MGIRTIGAALASCLLGVTPTAAAPAVPGVTDTEITIGITGPLSGPAAAWGSIALASEAYAQHVNQQGGVNGRKLKIVLKDDGYNPGRAVANFNEMKDQVFAVIGTVGTAVLNANKDVVAEAGLPLVFPLGNVQVFAKQPKEKVRTVFQAYPDYTDEGEFLVTQAAKLENVKKVAVFGQNDDYGKLGLEGVKKGLQKLPDVKLAAEVFYEVTDRELGTHALKMKESGADAVIFYSTATHAAGLIKEMAKVGFRPKIFSSFTLYDRDTMFRLLGDLWEGAYFNATQALRGEPPADRYIDIVTKIDPKLKGREGFSVQGAADVAILVEGLKRAGRNLTRESFCKAMETIHDFTDDGLTGGISFGPNRHHGYNSVRLMRAGKVNGPVTQITGYQQFSAKY
ncbi:MAG TPA: ABC transporter substrate-binding protein [Anaeromyxobacter sp.]